MATPRLLRRLAVLCAAAALAGGRGALAQQLIGNVSAVVDLIERVLPGESGRFALSLGACAGAAPPPCFTIADGAVPGASLALTASSASELSAGVGLYLREFLNVTIGWPRGGGSRVVLPPAGAPWPAVGTPVTRRRAAPFSYIENVCTHSYSLAWYDWPAWEKFIDWMALSGVNLVLSMTGQEEVQYKVFSQFGLSDEQIRTWVLARGCSRGGARAGVLARGCSRARRRDFLEPGRRSCRHPSA